MKSLFLNTLVLLASCIFSEGNIFPVDRARVEWSRKVAGNEIGIGNQIFHSNGYFFVSDGRCNIHLVDIFGNEATKVNGSESILCSAPLTFSPSRSFFLQARLESNETS